MVVIIDYGMGNLFSIQSALQYLGVESVIAVDQETIKRADTLILPGVGSFAKAMEHLERADLIETIKRSVNERGTPILGICLGMQLLGLSSTEDGFTEGLGFIDCPVERFSNGTYPGLKIPHVGFDSVSVVKESTFFNGLETETDFYFTHSYRMAFTGQGYCVATGRHGESFIAVFQKKHVCGTQFHPEKSQTNGLILLKNFLEKRGW